MDKFIFCCVFAVTFIEGVLCKKDDNGVENINDEKIVGGAPTTIQEYPYQAVVSVNNGTDYNLCGGTIISNYYIITAAHCLIKVQKLNIIIGSTNLEPGVKIYEIATFYSHPKFNFLTKDYDVAVIKTREAMNLDGTNATAINMVKIGIDRTNGKTLTVTGWGATKENGTDSVTLRVVRVPILSRKRCIQIFGSRFTSRMLCAGFPEGGKDSCQGDSGGPAVSGKAGKVVLVGITSFGDGCARPNSPGVYTRIGNSEIRLFIKNITGL